MFFFLITIASYGTLRLGLGLVRMNSATASLCAVIRFLNRQLEYVLNISWSLSNIFLLMISNAAVLFLYRLIRIFVGVILWSTDILSIEGYASQFIALIITAIISDYHDFLFYPIYQPLRSGRIWHKVNS